MSNHPNRSQFKITVGVQMEQGARLRMLARFAAYVEAKRYAEWISRELKTIAEIYDSHGNVVGRWTCGQQSQEVARA